MVDIKTNKIMIRCTKYVVALSLLCVPSLPLVTVVDSSHVKCPNGGLVLLWSMSRSNVPVVSRCITAT